MNNKKRNRCTALCHLALATAVFASVAACDDSVADEPEPTIRLTDDVVTQGDLIEVTTRWQGTCFDVDDNIVPCLGQLYDVELSCGAGCTTISEANQGAGVVNVVAEEAGSIQLRATLTHRDTGEVYEELFRVTVESVRIATDLELLEDHTTLDPQEPREEQF